ncbi:hypothetical protein ACWDA7_07615 [Streptomyces sp. NPDC001156]
MDEAAEIVCETPVELTNVIGSLHSGGLIALLDAAGLGALIASALHARALDGVVPLGTAADLWSSSPRPGDASSPPAVEEAGRTLEPLWRGETDRVRLATRAAITDAAGTVVCRGRFDWTVRRTAPAG